MYCRQCGTYNADSGKYCTGCGIPLNPAETVSEPPFEAEEKRIQKRKKFLLFIICTFFLAAAVGASIFAYRDQISDLYQRLQ
jgi:uncharacterized membrane protein YvbJ